MSERKPNLDEMMKDPQAAQLLKDKKMIADLVNSPDAKRLMQLLSQTGGDKLNSAAKAAMGGDTGALIELMGQVMRRPEGAKVVEDINKKINKK